MADSKKSAPEGMHWGVTYIVAVVSAIFCLICRALHIVSVGYVSFIIIFGGLYCAYESIRGYAAEKKFGFVVLAIIGGLLNIVVALFYLRMVVNGFMGGNFAF